jgi:hypothetical protein
MFRCSVSWQSSLISSDKLAIPAETRQLTSAGFSEIWRRWRRVRPAGKGVQA